MKKIKLIILLIIAIIGVRTSKVNAACKLYVTVYNYERGNMCGQSMCVGTEVTLGWASSCGWDDHGYAWRILDQNGDAIYIPPGNYDSYNYTFTTPGYYCVSIGKYTLLADSISYDFDPLDFHETGMNDCCFYVVDNLPPPLPDFTIPPLPCNENWSFFPVINNYMPYNNYSWDVYGPDVDYHKFNNEHIQISYHNKGTYTVCLRASNSCGGNSPQSCKTFVIGNIDDDNPCTIDLCDDVTGIVTHTYPPIMVTLSVTLVQLDCEDHICAIVSGGCPNYTYSWSPSEYQSPPPCSQTSTYGNKPYAKGIKPNTVYTVIVTDGSGQTATASILTTPVIIHFIQPTTPTSCDGIACVDADFGCEPPSYTYNWCGGTIAQSRAGLCIGDNCCVTVSDGCGHEYTCCEIFKEDLSVSATVTEPNCWGGVATASLSINPPYSYSYAWSTGATTSTIYQTAGSVSYTVSDGVCPLYSGIVVVTQPQQLISSYQMIPALCSTSNNGSIDLTVTGGTLPYSYSWNTTPVQTTANATGLSVGSYTAITTDANGCTTTARDILLTSNNPEVSWDTVYNASCHGESNGSILNYISNGTTPFSYLWSNGSTTQNITGLSAGTYSVIVSDANGCSTSLSDTISEPSALELHLDTIHNPPPQISNGLINITTLGGTPPYNYSWNGPNGFTSTSEDISGLFAGTYIVTFTDANGCSAIETIVLEATIPPTLGTYPDEILILGGNTTVTANTAPVNILSAVAYTNTNFTGTLTVDPLTGIVTVTDAKQAGTYTITVKGFGNGGLTATATFTLNVISPPCSNGLFTNATDVLVGPNPYSVAIGDFNKDGNQDLAVAIPDDNSISIRLGDGAGNFTGSTNVPVGNSPRWVSVGDFNGDGNEDIATANANGNNASIRLGDGNGNFSGSTEVPVGASPFCVALGDFNGDAKLDIAVANPDGNDVSIRLGDGAGGFSGSTQVPVQSLPYVVVIGDFNNDGNQDLASANAISSSVSIRIGDGLGNFSGSLNIVTGAGVKYVQVGDFNSDGNQDIVATNQNSNNISILQGDGSGNFIVTSTLGAGINPWSSAIGDFNSDGNQDIITANYGGDVTEWLGNGTGGFTSGTDVSVTNNPFSIAVGDFDNDSAQDLAITNFGANTVSIRLGLGGTIGTEINLTGNSIDIIDGDLTPDVADETDFGNVNVDENLIRTYTIQNISATDLPVNGMSMSGTNASLFSIGVLTPPSPIAANTSATFTVTFSPTSSGVKTATVHIANDDCNESDYDFALQGTGTGGFVILNQNILLEGFYLGGGMMSPCLSMTGVSADPLDTDTIFISAMNSASPYAEVDRQPGILKTNGDVTVTFGAEVIVNNSYYLKINHRNSVETWSANPVLFTETTSYSFSSATSQAFASNEAISFDALYAVIYVGDINQDGAIDGSDFLELDPSIQNGDGGYAVGDLNGDGSVDGSDFLVLDPNIQYGIGASIP